MNLCKYETRENRKNTPDFALACAGVLATLLALRALMHTGSDALVRIAPSDFAALLLLGAGLAATAFGKRIPAALCGIAVLAAGMLDITLGFYELLHLDALSPLPLWQITPPVALCVSLSASALLLRNTKNRPHWRLWLSGAIGSIVASAGCAALLGDLWWAAARQSWVRTPAGRSMAAAFIVLGAGILVSSWRQVRPAPKCRLAALPAGASVVLAAVCLSFTAMAAETRQAWGTVEPAAEHLGQAGGPGILPAFVPISIPAAVRAAVPPLDSPTVLLWVVGGVGVLVALLGAIAGYLAQTANLRAKELEKANAELQREIAERKRIQEALDAARVELEARVEQRTLELARANEELKAEIAERRRAEETLRASEHRYRELFDGAKDLIYVHDLNGNFTSINKAAQKITGYTADEALKMNIAQLVVPEDLETVYAMVARNLGGDPNATYELKIITKDGRRLTLEVSTHLVYRNGNPVAVQGIARDITERKRLEEQFLQSQKMEAVGRLAGGVAHDFNNLLTVIGAYSQMISDSLPDDDRLRGYAQEILWAAERAGTLTNRLLAFSRRQVVQPRIVDLNGLIVTLDNMLRRLIGEDIELKIVLEPGAGAVKADQSHLEQVIMNLVVNARDAMRTGGRLSIKTSRVELSESEKGGPDLPPGSYVVLEVIDTGVGMTPEVMGHLFEPFFTTKESGKGTGLGLSTVYGIVKQCGGDIQVRSTPGVGTHFTLYFPRANGQIAPPAERAPASTPPPADREVILLVEDEYGVRKLVRKMLMHQGYRVIEASCGEEALRICEQHPGPIHLLLSDVVMPNMSGRELASRLCAVRPELKVLYMTGYTEDAIVQHGVLEPGVAVLNKPFLSDVLARKVREVLDNGKR